MLNSIKGKSTFMSGYHIVVCGSVVPDPLQPLIPVSTPQGPGLKNELMLPHVLDPWAAHALYEAAHLASLQPESRIWLVSLGPKAKLQQVMMTMAQKVPFELVVLDAPASGFTDSATVAEKLTTAIQSIDSLDPEKMLLFGGWESASRANGTTLQMVGERLGITEQFQGVDELTVREDGSMRILERLEGGIHQVSVCQGPPMVLGWATGNLPEPPNNPQIGMKNMRTIMPAIQKAQPVDINDSEFTVLTAEQPQQRRDTRVEKDMSEEDIARELVDWLKQ
jgi:electron transfer flavoprotein beta subunit